MLKNHTEGKLDRYWLDPNWNDQTIQTAVEEAIQSAQVLAPKWGWPLPRSYNGFSGAERVIGWQKVKVAIKLELIPQPRICSICLKTPAGQMHNENYSRPILAKPICPSCHRILHQRFHYPKTWKALQQLHGRQGFWFDNLN